MLDRTTRQVMRDIGASGVKASGVGLGTWAIGGWMWGGTDEAESIAAIQASLDAGVTLIDTAPAYGLGRAEEIVGKALKGRRDQALGPRTSLLLPQSWNQVVGRVPSAGDSVSEDHPVGLEDRSFLLFLVVRQSFTLPFQHLKS